MSAVEYALCAYLAAISVIAVAVCAADKRRAKVRGTRRVPEAALLTIAALGGSVAMLITMLLIRHKTRKAKFTVGIPVIIAVQLFAAWLVCRFTGVV